MQDVFNIAVVIFTVANIGAMGLGLDLRETLTDLRSIRLIGLILLWGWVLGPALAWPRGSMEVSILRNKPRPYGYRRRSRSC